MSIRAINSYEKLPQSVYRTIPIGKANYKSNKLKDAIFNYTKFETGLAMATVLSGVAVTVFSALAKIKR